MFNVFKMHMYRAGKAKSTLLLSIILLLFLIFTFLLALFIFDDPLHLGMGVMFSASNVSSIDELDAIMSGNAKVAINAATAHNFMVQKNDAFIILMTIFIVIFTNCDFAGGFAKNTYGMFENKWRLVLSKWMAMTACTTVVYLFFSLVGTGLCVLCLRSCTIGEISDFLLSLGVVYICLVAMLTMVFFITTLFKSPAGGMVIGLVIATGILQTVEMLLDILIAYISGADMEEALLALMGFGQSDAFRISDYCLDNVYLSYSVKMGSADTIRTVIVALVHMAVFLGLAMFLSNKKDVRC